MKNLYDRDYFECGIESGKSCYSNYRWIPELTIPMAFRLIEYLNILPSDKILDFGCAKGYLVKAFRLLYREAFGYDISDYARATAPADIKNYILDDYHTENYDWVISKDVFEHIPYEEIDDTIKSLSIVAKKIFCVVPLGENNRYVIPAYELDATHIIRENLHWWENRFMENGLKVQVACYKVKHIKENWESYEKGNGFFILSSKQ